MTPKKHSLPLTRAALVCATLLPVTAWSAGCDVLNGKWLGSENAVGLRDSADSGYDIKINGNDVTVSNGVEQGTGTCDVTKDAYVLKLKWPKVTSEMTFHVMGDDVAMFNWTDSAGQAGRGALTKETPAAK